MKVIVFWYTKLGDNEYLSNIIKMIYKFVIDYQNIDDQRKWCIDVIDNEVIHSRELSEQLYDGHLDNNKPIVTISDIGKIAAWKDDNCRELCYAEFKVYIDKDLNFLENNSTDRDIQKEIYYDGDKLTYNGLFEFFPRIHDNYLIDISAKNKLNQLMKNITNSFLSGIKERYEKLSKLTDNNIIGLNDI